MKNTFLFLSALILLSFNTAAASTIIVDQNKGPIWSINEAMSQALDGDTILVKPGVYVEYINITKLLYIIGSGHEVTKIINGGITVHFDKQGDIGGLLKGFTVISELHNGLLIDNSRNIVIEHCIIEKCGKNGIHIKSNNSSNQAAAIIRNCIIRDNACDGIIMEGYANPIINNCIIYNHNGFEYGGIRIYRDDAQNPRPVIFSNIIYDNYDGIIRQFSAMPTYVYNDVWNNYNANYSGLPPGEDDISKDPLFCNVPNDNFRLQCVSPCIDAGRPGHLYLDLNGTCNDMGVYGGPNSWVSEALPVSAPIAELTFEDFEKMSDFGYYISGDVDYVKPSGEEGGGDGKYEYSFKSRDVNPKYSLSTMFKLDFNHTIPSSTESATGDFSLTGRAGPSKDFARFTYNYYLDNSVFDKQVFVVCEPQIKYENHFDKNNPQRPVTTTAVFAGVGFGRLYPTGNYHRVKDFIEILHEHGLLIRRLTKDEYETLMSILVNSWDSEKETRLALCELEEMNLLSKNPSNEVILALIKAIEESLDYREDGSEFVFGIHYTFQTKEAVVVGPDVEVPDLTQIALSYKRTFTYNKVVIMPMAEFYQEFTPSSSTNISAGGNIDYVVSPRLKCYLRETFIYESYDNFSESSNEIELGTSYKLLTFFDASLKSTLTSQKDTKPYYSFNFSIGIGMAGL